MKITVEEQTREMIPHGMVWTLKNKKDDIKALLDDGTLDESDFRIIVKALQKRADVQCSYRGSALSEEIVIKQKSNDMWPHPYYCTMIKFGTSILEIDADLDEYLYNTSHSETRDQLIQEIEQSETSYSVHRYDLQYIH